MRKEYQTTRVEIHHFNTESMMIPAITSDLEPHLVPKRNYVPGPGASYQPPAKIV